MRDLGCKLSVRDRLWFRKRKAIKGTVSSVLDSMRSESTHYFHTLSSVPSPSFFGTCLVSSTTLMISRVYAAVLSS